MDQVTRTITKGSPERLRQIRYQLDLSQERFARTAGSGHQHGGSMGERDCSFPPKVAELAAEYLYLLLTHNEGGR